MFDINKPILFCGVGGSGMMPLAMILRGHGYSILGSDRSYDQGKTPEKFSYLINAGIQLVPQDGRAVQNNVQAVVVSAAIEPTIPDVAAALERNIPIITRAQLLSDLFNAAKNIRVAVGGTSGKSTVTGMIGFVLEQAGYNPTVMNGAVMLNYVSVDNTYASALVGGRDVFVTEADESDGTISLYRPSVAVLNNIALDHKSIEELVSLFSNFVYSAPKAVVNLDNEGSRNIAEKFKDKVLSYSLKDSSASLFASNILLLADGVEADIHYAGSISRLKIVVPGKHNLSNALAAIGAAIVAGVEFFRAVHFISLFKGIRRRLEVVGSAGGVTVIDDFGHNPDKIAATLSALREFDGRLLLFFQPHGFAPLRLMGREIADSFSSHMGNDDILLMPDVLYLGGTVDRSINSIDVIRMVQERGKQSFWHETRDECLDAIVSMARAGDRIVIMGARDDTLSDFAREALRRLG